MSSSGPGPSTERADGRRNKQLILAAASEAFMENPQVSVSEIAERAGLTRATVYRHYPDRGDLVAAVAAESSAHLIPALLADMAPLPLGPALDLLARRAVALGMEHRDVVMLIAPRLEESVRLAVAGEPIEVELSARRARGEITLPVPDQWLALCIRTICLSAIARLTEDEVDFEAVAGHLAATLRAVCGISPQVEPPA